MKPPPNNEDRPPVAYHLLDRWMRIMALLVPPNERATWITEWDGELWYGIAAKQRPRLHAAVGLAVGMSRDAVHVRRLQTNKPGRHRRLRDERMHSVITDVRLGLRRLRKAPGFTVVVAVMLALGIGAATTVFSVVNSLLLNPLPYPDADRLVIMWQGRPAAQVDRDWFSGGHYSDIREQTNAFEELALVTGGAYTMTGRGNAARVGWV